MHAIFHSKQNIIMVKKILKIVVPDARGCPKEFLKTTPIPVPRLSLTIAAKLALT